MSWSRNCPYCISIRVYLEWRWDTSAWTMIDTRRGDGNGFEPTDLNLGREMAAKKEEGLRNL